MWQILDYNVNFFYGFFLCRGAAESWIKLQLLNQVEVIEIICLIGEPGGRHGQLKAEK